MAAQQEATDLAGEVAAAVDGEEATTTTTTTRLHHTTRTIPATPSQATARHNRHKAGGLASGRVRQVALLLDGLRASLATEATGTTRRAAGALETEVAVAGTTAERVAQGVRLVIVSPAPGMRALGLEELRADDVLVINFSIGLRMIPPFTRYGHESI